MLDERVALVQEKNASLGGDVVTGVTGEEVQVVKPIDLARLRKDLSECLEKGIKAVAVSRRAL
jgi:N-methylhydantoinase A/oxoprolinase/acetone carboxylase beta subunit